MADFTALKTAIQTYIKQNGNEEITGNILQEVLLAMVQTMGDGAINDLVTALSNEMTNRQNADGTLQNNINAEALARGNADTALGGRLTTVEGAITAINTKLSEGYVYAGIATPSTNPGSISGKVFYIAVQAGTYTNFGGTAVTEGITILKYNGTSWVKEQALFTDGGVFDISAYNNDTYDDLSDALSGTNVPTNVRKGGMIVKFVQSSDNKYVQYTYVGTSTDAVDFTNTDSWEKINLEKEVDELDEIVNGVTGGDNVIHYDRTDSINYSINSSNLWQDINESIIIPIIPGKTYKVSGDETKTTIVGVLASIDNIGYMTSVDFATGYSARVSVPPNDIYTFIAPNDAAYISLLIVSSAGDLYPVLSEHIESREGLVDVVPELSQRIGVLEQSTEQLEGSVDVLEEQNNTVFNDKLSLASQVKILDADVNNRILFNKEFVNNTAADWVLKKICWYALDTTCKFYICILKPTTSVNNYRILSNFYIGTSVAGLNEKEVNILVPVGCCVGIHGTRVEGETMPEWGNQSSSGTLGCMHATFADISYVSVGEVVSLVDLTRSTAYGCLFAKESFLSEGQPYIIERVVIPNQSNYNSIRDVVNDISDASPSKIYHVIVPKGRWFESDLSGKPYVKIIGVDREESIVYCDGDADKPIPSNYAAEDYDEKSDFSYSDTLAETKKIYKHCVYCAAETYIENLRIEAHNTKYCVHIDSTSCNKAVFKDCHIYAIKDGTYAKELNHPIGIGLRGNQSVYFKKCIIESEIVGIGVFAHNFVNSTSGCKLSIQNCYFKNCGYLKTGELGSGQNDIFELLNCTSDLKMVQAEVDATTAEENPQNVPYSIKVNACGTDVVAVQTPVVKGVVSRPNFVHDFMSNFALTMGIGDVPGCAIGKVYTGYMVIKDKYMRVRVASSEPQNPIVGVVFNVTDKFAYLVPKGHVAMIPVSAISSTTKTGTAYVDTNGYLTTDVASSVTDIGAIGVIYTEYNTSDYVYLAMF